MSIKQNRIVYPQIYIRNWIGYCRILKIPGIDLPYQFLAQIFPLVELSYCVVCVSLSQRSREVLFKEIIRHSPKILR